MFNTVTGKKIAVLGYAFKKDTGDTRETAAANVCASLINEMARVVVYDPKVKESSFAEALKYAGCDMGEASKYVHRVDDPYEACSDSHAIAIMTEWDEFKSYDY